MIRCALTSLLFCTWLASPVHADEEPLPVTEAFQYVVSDTGQAFEIDWAIADGYYLYKKKLGFESPDPRLVLGQPELPQGLDYEDEFFGPQQIYRDRLYVKIPYTMENRRPATVDLVIKSQGCSDLGLCYPPQTWTTSVELSAIPKMGASSALDQAFGGLGSPGGSGDFPPVDEVFIPDVFPVDGSTVEVGFQIASGFYLYKDKFSVRSLTDDAKAGRLELPRGKTKIDEYFGARGVAGVDEF